MRNDRRGACKEEGLSVMDRIHLQIVTAQSSVCNCMAGFVLVPLIGGDEGILADHAAMLGAVCEGVVRYTADGKEHFTAVSGGILSLADNELVILARSAEMAENIDLARAEASEKRARERIAHKNESLDLKRAELSLMRALAREKAYDLYRKI